MKSTMNPRQRIRAVYSGTVQGVGFRFSAKRAATRLGVSGFVRNLPNGKVEVVAEGYEQQLNDLIKDIGTVMSGYINDCHLEWEASQGEFTAFDIRF